MYKNGLYKHKILSVTDDTSYSNIGVLFLIFFLVVWLSFFCKFICYFVSDYLHYKLYGELLFDPETTRDVLLLTSHLDGEFEQIKKGQKAKGHSPYRISFMIYYCTTITMRYTVLPLIIVSILFFTLFFIFEDMFI